MAPIWCPLFAPENLWATGIDRVHDEIPWLRVTGSERIWPSSIVRESGSRRGI